MKTDASRALLRHTVATLAYRAEKTLRGAPARFGDFAVSPGTRTPAQILAHMGDLFDWALWMAKGKHVWHDSTPLEWDAEVRRFFATVEAFDAHLESSAVRGSTVERLFQGPIADSLTHTGQLSLLRRLAGKPVKGENYAKADIAAGATGRAQAAPRVEFD